MRISPSYKAFSIGAALSATLVVGSMAQTATTSPVGFNSVACLGSSDTYTSIPFTRQPAYAGATSAVPAGNSVSFSGTPFTASQFKYVAGSLASPSTQPNTYYLYVLSGPKEGFFYTITDNTSSSVTVDPAGDTIASIAAGSPVQIIPYWTLNTAFPAGAGTNTSASTSNPPGQILLPDQATAGINLSNPNVYYYYTGASFGGPGWRRVGSALTAGFNEVVLYPDTYFIVRNNVATATTFTPVGYVPTLSAATTVNGTPTIAVNVPTTFGTLAANVSQDNALALPVATSTTLAGSNLFQSGLFAGTASTTPVDQLLIYDNNTTAINKSASKVYYYYTGSSFGGPGWRQVGGGLTSIKDTDMPFQPGNGFKIRKAASSTPSLATWNFRPIYAP